MNASPQKDGMKVISLSGSQRSDDSFMSVGTKAVVGQQRVEIERLQAELAGRDAELEKLRAENLSLRSTDRGSGEEPPVATGTAAPAPSDPSVLSKASSPGQLATIAEPSGAPASAPAGAPAGSAPAASERQAPKRAQSASSSRQRCINGVTHAVSAAGVKKPDAQASQGVRTEHVGKGVSAASGQLAQAAYTDYEALLDDAFSAIKEIIACCKMMQAHAQPCTHPSTHTWLYRPAGLIACRPACPSALPSVLPAPIGCTLGCTKHYFIGRRITVSPRARPASSSRWASPPSTPSIRPARRGTRLPLSLLSPYVYPQSPCCLPTISLLSSPLFYSISRPALPLGRDGRRGG